MRSRIHGNPGIALAPRRYASSYRSDELVGGDDHRSGDHQHVNEWSGERIGAGVATSNVSLRLKTTRLSRAASRGDSVSLPRCTPLSKPFAVWIPLRSDQALSDVWERTSYVLLSGAVLVVRLSWR